MSIPQVSTGNIMSLRTGMYLYQFEALEVTAMTQTFEWILDTLVTDTVRNAD